MQSYDHWMNQWYLPYFCVGNGKQCKYCLNSSSYSKIGSWFTGQVEIDIEMDSGSVTTYRTSPVNVAIIMAFQEKGQWPNNSHMFICVHQCLCMFVSGWMRLDTGDVLRRKIIKRRVFSFEFSAKRISSHCNLSLSQSNIKVLYIWVASSCSLPSMRGPLRDV